MVVKATMFDLDKITQYLERVGIEVGDINEKHVVVDTQSLLRCIDTLLRDKQEGLNHVR